MAFTDRLANRGSISTGYDIENSVLLVGANCEGEITQTGGDRKTHTISFWHKRAPIGPGSGAGELDGAGEDLWGTPSEGDTLRFSSSDLAFFHEGGTGSSLVTDRKFRDLSAWYHFVVAIDTTQGTAANRIKIYVNGVQETSFSTETYPDQNDEFKLMENSQVFRIGAGHGGTTSATGQGYYADFIIVDGAAKAASDFGEFNDDGIWVPKEYTGDFNTGSGTNGAHYKFEGTAEGTGAGSTGLDSGGESNNMNFENQKGGLTDTPTNNFCTLNPNDMTVNATYRPDITLGNLKYEASGSGASTIRGTMGMSSGKWYWEVKVATNANGSVGVGTANAVIPITSSQDGGHMWSSPTGDTHSFNIYANSHFYSRMSRAGTENNTQVAYASGTMDAGTIMSVAYDADNQDIYLGKAGSWTDVVSGQDPTQGGGTDTAYTYHSYFNNDEDTIWLPTFSEPYNQDMEVNFGNPIHAITSGNADANGYGNFEYAPPTGYYALCTKNLAEFG